MAPSPFLAPVEPSEELAAWAPISYISPCFTHYRADDATVRCLTKTQVALHEQRLLYQSLLAQAADSKNEWDRSRAELVRHACNTHPGQTRLHAWHASDMCGMHQLSQHTSSVQHTVSDVITRRRSSCADCKFAMQKQSGCSRCGAEHTVPMSTTAHDVPSAGWALFPGALPDASSCLSSSMHLHCLS